MPLAQLLEQYVSLGIFVLAAGLSVLSFLAWRRERDGRMRIVTLGYAMFAVYGLIVFLEYPLLPYFSYATLELLEQVESTGEYEHSPLVTADNTLMLLKKKTGIG